MAAFGNGTASFLLQKKLKPAFTGTGKPEEVATAFLKIANGQKVLFPRAKNSRQSIRKLLGKNIEAVDLIVYENILRTDFNLNICPFGDFDCLVFTSPMNAEAYFNKKQLIDNQKVIAIGVTTGDALKELGIMKI